jgi:hypothetical protein
MSDIELTHSDESRDDAFSDLDIADLRKYAKLMGISAQRDWKTEDFVRAIKTKQNAAALSYTEDTSTEGSPNKLKPGEARIIIFRDPSPGHSNSAVPLGLNGRQFLAPRGVEFVIPLEYIGVLADAKARTIVQKEAPSIHSPEGRVVEEDILSYPFQVLEVCPHNAKSRFQSGADQRASMYNRRLAFVEEFGKWPTLGELMEFEKTQREEKRTAQALERRLTNQ